MVTLLSSAYNKEKVVVTGMEDIVKQVGANVRKYRELKGMTREQFCEVLGYDVNYWGCIERGERPINLQKLLEVSVYFGVSLDTLVSVSKPAPEDSPMLSSVQEALRSCSETQLAAVQKFLLEIIPWIK